MEKNISRFLARRKSLPDELLIKPKVISNKPDAASNMTILFLICLKNRHMTENFNQMNTVILHDKLKFQEWMHKSMGDPSELNARQS